MSVRTNVSIAGSAFGSPVTSATTCSLSTPTWSSSDASSAARSSLGNTRSPSTARSTPGSATTCAASAPRHSEQPSISRRTWGHTRVWGRKRRTSQSNHQLSALSTGERPYSCDVCGRGFRVRADMVRHRSNVHQKPATETQRINLQRVWAKHAGQLKRENPERDTVVVDRSMTPQ